ncbi:vanin-like protein 1 isoform X2 [Linepithema humile]|uniref:vanin-like protein 1 isoform X2 n=1 Tax=Linepithema humile TaxID=83485 RepID=UPI000623213A|nr:PREDICTED: vanin-like protein 1 isoform X2 [Linepithema humile]
MNQQWIIVYLLVACTHLSHQRSTPNSPTYRAAVLNYFSAYVSNNTELTLNMNCAEYVKLIEIAQTMDVDIIVFPEYGLTSIDLLTIDDISSWATEIPYVTDNYVPCTKRSGSVNDVLIKISCAAKQNRIYVVINVVERTYSFQTKKTIYYSSNVVFDRTGRIIAKYRKTIISEKEAQLFDFPLWNQIKQLLTLTDQDEAIFNTDFGVKFATFTSYDILFSEPALQFTRMKNITDIVHPTVWYSETPFFTATQIEAGWSFAENVNLLTSSYNRPTSSNTGGGIYLGRKGLGKVILPNTDSLITYDVPKINRNKLESLKLSSFAYYYHDFIHNSTKQKIQLR